LLGNSSLLIGVIRYIEPKTLRFLVILGVKFSTTFSDGQNHDKYITRPFMRSQIEHFSNSILCTKKKSHFVDQEKYCSSQNSTFYA
jgi:hypothetical protein